LVITGGCGVSGEFLVIALINAGAKVAILDYKKGRCRGMFGGDSQAGRLSVLCCVGVLEKQSLIDAKNQINSEFGKVDVFDKPGAGRNSPSQQRKDEFITEDNINDLFQNIFWVRN